MEVYIAGVKIHLRHIQIRVQGRMCSVQNRIIKNTCYQNKGGGVQGGAGELSRGSQALQAAQTWRGQRPKQLRSGSPPPPHNHQ